MENLEGQTQLWQRKELQGSYHHKERTERIQETDREMHQETQERATLWNIDRSSPRELSKIKKRLTNSSKKRQINLKTLQATRSNRILINLIVPQMSQKMRSLKELFILWIWWRRSYKETCLSEKISKNSQNSLTTAMLRSFNCLKKTRI